MLKFYYNPVSANARRVWIALLEKHITFEAIAIALNGDQFEHDFTTINPLQRVPVIIDDGFRVIESLAILDYLEAKFPTPTLMPTQPEQVATVRMVEMVAVNELQPAMVPLTCPLVGLTVDTRKQEAAKERVIAIMQFYETLIDTHSYFVGEEFTLADIVAGSLVPSLPMLGFAFDDFPRLDAWSQRLATRASWQQTTPSQALIAAALPNIKTILERRS
jgi:glutathione S-transferase